MNRKRSTHQKGFTLTEVLITMTLIGIIVGFAYSFFNMTINQYFTLQRDADAFYSLSHNYQRIANVLRGLTDINSASASDLTVRAYFAPKDSVISQVRYYIDNGSLMAEVTPFTANPPAGVLIPAQKKTYTIIPNYYAQPGLDTFVYLNASNTVMANPITDLAAIKSIRINLAVSSVAPNTNHQALNSEVNIRNRKTNL